MATTSRVTGVKEVRRNFDKVRHEIHGKILDLVQAEADIILARSKELVGVDTGALRDSGKVASVVQVDTVNGTETSAVISYGDPDPYYAIYAHERDQANNKYLERAIRERADETGREFVEAVRDVVK